MKRIIKKITVIAALSLVLVLATACGNSKSIVGTWNYYNGATVSNDIYYNFEKGNEGSYTYSGNTRKFIYEDRGNKVSIQYDGDTMASEFDYSIDDGILTIKDSFGNDVKYKRK